MPVQSDVVRRFTDAWKRGDDNAIERISTEIAEGGDPYRIMDDDLAAVCSIMRNTRKGSGK